MVKERGGKERATKIHSSPSTFSILSSFSFSFIPSFPLLRISTNYIYLEILLIQSLLLSYQSKLGFRKCPFLKSPSTKFPMTDCHPSFFVVFTLNRGYPEYCLLQFSIEDMYLHLSNWHYKIKKNVKKVVPILLTTVSKKLVFSKCVVGAPF